MEGVTIKVLDSTKFQDAVEVIVEALNHYKKGCFSTGEKIAIETLLRNADYEKKLGISFDTLFRVLDYPIYIEKDFMGNKIDSTEWCSNRLIGNLFKDGYLIGVGDTFVKTTQFGKTWGYERGNLKGENDGKEK